MENTLSSRLQRFKFTEYEPWQKAKLLLDAERPEQTTVRHIADLYPASVREIVAGGPAVCRLVVRHEAAQRR
jgi:hypothetical protein